VYTISNDSVVLDELNILLLKEFTYTSLEFEAAPERLADPDSTPESQGGRNTGG